MGKQEYRSSYGASYALVIGINSYSDPRFVPLGAAEQDASAFAALLSAPPYNFQTTLLLGAQATRQAILAELHKLRRTKPDDRIIVYFAGHGYTLTDLNGFDTGYFATADTTPDQDYTALEMDEVTGLSRNTYAKHIAFIFDACFSGQALGLTRAASVAADKYLVMRACQALSAGAGDQTVSDFQSMTHTIVEALRTGEVSRDGMVTFSELSLYVSQTIAADTRHTQIPQFGSIKGSKGGEFVFYREEGPLLPASLSEALRSEMPNTRRGAVADLMTLAHDSDEALAAVARERLHQIAQNDPNERVRAAARRFFGTEGGEAGYDSAQDIRISKPAKALTAAPVPADNSKSMLPRYAVPIGIGGAAVLVLLIVIAFVLNGAWPENTQSGSLTPDSETNVAVVPSETDEPTTQPTLTTSTTSQATVVFDTDRHGAMLNVSYFGAREPIEANETILACLGMLIDAGGGVNPANLDSLWIDNGLTNDELFDEGEIVQMGSSFGVELEWVWTAGGTQEEAFTLLKENIDAGKPLGVYINYETIRNEDFASSELSRATVLVVGYTDGTVIVHDPVGQAYRQWPIQLFINAWTQLSLTAFVPVSPIQTGWLTDGFDPPVGSSFQRGDFLADWPGRWSDANPYLSEYSAGYSTGASLNLNFPEFDSDRGAPVYAAGSGSVVQIRVSSYFGTIVIIQHDPLEDGTLLWTRYASIDNLQVQEGQRVRRGQPLGVIGENPQYDNSFLLFDIATTDVLVIDPEDGPGVSFDVVQANYVDPLAFILAHRP